MNAYDFVNNSYLDGKTIRFSVLNNRPIAPSVEPREGDDREITGYSRTVCGSLFIDIHNTLTVDVNLVIELAEELVQTLAHAKNCETREDRIRGKADAINAFKSAAFALIS